MVGGIEGVGDEEFVDIVGDVAGDVLRNKKQKNVELDEFEWYYARRIVTTTFFSIRLNNTIHYA